METIFRYIYKTRNESGKRANTDENGLGASNVVGRR